MRRQRSDNQKHHSLRTAKKTDVALRNETFSPRAGVADHHRAHQRRTRQKDVERRMVWRIAGVKDHQSDENNHVGETIQRGVKKPAETSYATGEPRHLPIEHVKKIGDYQDDSGPEEIAESEEQPAADVYRYADDGEKVRIDPTLGQSTHYRTNNSLRAASDT
ncbi:MAG: hypothetical protein QOJ64_2833 [Acidobacteriota bacterium]|nr:hypothetical protein [Acidobacteriota bacterium]